ncbi:MAG TPA: hypothetical protein VMF69_11210 [Gemmataceae bacterium]|nr:hypothetical protein [Gemmataceae bacterium]
MSWTHRVSRSPRTPPLRQVQEAAENIADHAGIAPGKARVVFGIVTDVAILTSAVIGGALGAVHLWRTLFPKHHEQQSPAAVGGNRSPPRRPGRRVAAAADDPGGFGEEESRYR